MYFSLSQLISPPGLLISENKYSQKGTIVPRVTIIKTHFVVKNMHGDIQQSLTSKIKLLSTFGITLASICQLLADIACNCPAEENINGQNVR